MNRAALALLIVLPVCALRSQSQLRSLVAAERAFAAATRELGVRDGFLTFFADDAVTFQPGPGNARERLLKRPRPTFPLPALLLWNPAEGDVARSGDLGYLTGPSAVRGGTRLDSTVYTGQYFSVWRRQADGTWKVILDAGTEVPERTIDPDTVGFTPSASFEVDPDTTLRGTLEELKGWEVRLNASYSSDLAAASQVFSSFVRLHVDGREPVVGREEAVRVVRAISGGERRSVAVGISTAGDLGYSYGTYGSAGATKSYARVWKMMRDGWRVVLEWNG